MSDLTRKCEQHLQTLKDFKVFDKAGISNTDVTSRQEAINRLRNNYEYFKKCIVSQKEATNRLLRDPADGNSRLLELRQQITARMQQVEELHQAFLEHEREEVASYKKSRFSFYKSKPNFILPASVDPDESTTIDVNAVNEPIDENITETFQLMTKKDKP